jgi:lipoprotein-anchoring transpeptidase ErfK/SrfK
MKVSGSHQWKVSIPGKTLILAAFLVATGACRNESQASNEPRLEAAPMGGTVGRWRLVTAETVKLSGAAPGAQRVTLLYRPFAAVARHAELATVRPEGKTGAFSFEWKAGADLAGDVWAEISYPDGAKKKTEPLPLASEAAVSGQSGEVALDSVGGSVSSDESARADKFTGGRIEKAALKSGDRRVWITVDVPAFRLTLWQNGKEVKTYQIGIGRKNFQLPVGPRKASEIIWNPEWVPPDSSWVEDSDDVEPGERIDADDPRNPLGKIKIRLGDAVLIHEAAKPSDIGHLVSHGCVRMLTADLYDLSEKIVEARNLPVPRERIEETKTNAERLSVKLDPPLWVDINYDNEVIEGRQLHLYPDVYGRGAGSPARLRAELQQAGVAADRLDDETLKQMVGRANRAEAFTVNLDDIKAGRALTAGWTRPLVDSASPQPAKKAEKMSDGERKRKEQ